VSEALVHALLQNVRLGWRSLRRAPAFALTAVLTLALGIGLATAVFTVAEALLLRRLPVRDQDRLVVLTGVTPDGRMNNFPLGLEPAREFAAGAQSLARVAHFAYEGASAKPVREGERITRLRRALVSGDYFDVLGARPVLGRALRPEDDAAGAAPVVVLSHRAWQERFGGAADVLGRRIVMHEDGVAYTVVGVMPQGLDYPRGADAWAALLAATPARSVPHLAVHLLGRLAPGATPAGAEGELTAFYRREGSPGWLRELRGLARPLPALVLGDTRPAVLAFAAAAGLLLLVTCIDVANLLLVRGLARVREVAVRAALGAGRGRVVGQLVTEHALLAVAGGALGVAVAAAAVRGFVAFAPPGLPRLDEIGLDATALAAAVGITAAAMLLFALAPAVLASRVELNDALRAGARHGAGRGTRLAREALVAGQVALALVVLSAAGLIGRSLLALQRAELAFEPARLVVAELALRADRYDGAPAQLAMLERLLPAVRAIPGVQGASPVVSTPFAEAAWDGRPVADGQTPEQVAASPMLNMEVVAPEYFATLGVPVTRGRGFTDADVAGAPGVVVLSESAARHYWPDADPIGKRLRMGGVAAGAVVHRRRRGARDAVARPARGAAEHLLPAAAVVLPVRADDARGALDAHAGGPLGRAAPGARRDGAGRRARERRAVRHVPRRAARAAADERAAARRVRRRGGGARRDRAVRRARGDGAPARAGDRRADGARRVGGRRAAAGAAARARGRGGRRGGRAGRRARGEPAARVAALRGEPGGPADARRGGGGGARGRRRRERDPGALGRARGAGGRAAGGVRR
jgi:predicted permease